MFLERYIWFAIAVVIVILASKVNILVPKKKALCALIKIDLSLKNASLAYKSKKRNNQR